MNIQECSVGSILLETLISIVILGLIATGSFYSYSFVYQRIHSQRQQRFALSVLQGWMEETISSLLDPADWIGGIISPTPDPNEPLNPIILKDSKNKRDIEEHFRKEFENEISTMIDSYTNINPEIAFIKPNISLNCINDDMIEIEILGTLTNNEDLVVSKNDLQIRLYTRIYPK